MLWKRQQGGEPEVKENERRDEDDEKNENKNDKASIV